MKFLDDEISVSKFGFLPQIFGVGILLIGSKIPPHHGSCVQAAAGLAAADQCRHLLICFAESPEYPAHEDVCFGSAHFSIFYCTAPPLI